MTEQNKFSISTVQTRIMRLSTGQFWPDFVKCDYEGLRPYLRKWHCRGTVTHQLSVSCLSIMNTRINFFPRSFGEQQHLRGAGDVGRNQNHRAPQSAPPFSDTLIESPAIVCFQLRRNVSGWLTVCKAHAYIIFVKIRIVCIFWFKRCKRIYKL